MHPPIHPTPTPSCNPLVALRVVRVDHVALEARRARRAPGEAGATALLPLGGGAARGAAAGAGGGRGGGRGAGLGGGGGGGRRDEGGGRVAAAAGAAAAAGEDGRAGDSVLAGGGHAVDVDQEARVGGLVDAWDAVGRGAGGAGAADDVDLSAFHLVGC